MTEVRTIHLERSRILVRPLTRAHREAVQALHRRCSPQSQWLRYFTAMPTLPASAFNAFCDRGRGLGLVALHGGQAIALGHLLYTPDPFAGELALLVEDHWQGRRLGTALAGLLVDDAQDGGLTEVRGTVIAENHRTRRLLWRLGATIRPAAEPGLVEVRLMIERAPAV